MFRADVRPSNGLKSIESLSFDAVSIPRLIKVSKDQNRRIIDKKMYNMHKAPLGDVQVNESDVGYAERASGLCVRGEQGGSDSLMTDRKPKALPGSVLCLF